MTVRTKLGSLVPLVFAALLVAACSGSDAEGHAKAGEVQRDDQSTAVTGSSTTQNRKLLAPPVPRALKASPFLSKDQICKIVSPEQAEELGLTKPHIGKRVESGLATRCHYDSDETMGNSIAAGFSMVHKNGLSDVYARKSKNEYWRPFKVQGYPSVITDKNDEGQNCSLHLGVTDQLEMRLSYYGKGSVSAEQACKRDKKLAGMVISNLKLQE